jgi:hypothetical protein
MEPAKSPVSALLAVLILLFASFFPVGIGQNDRLIAK